MAFMCISFRKFNRSRDSRNALKKINFHNIRAYRSKNVYIQASKQNQHIGVYDVDSEIERRLRNYEQTLNENSKRKRKNKVRKNAVTCITAVMQVGAGHYRDAKNKEDYLQRDKDFIEHCKMKLYEQFGEENVLSIDIHRDETREITLEDGFKFFPTHIHANIIPIDPDGKLNASYWLNGREKLRQQQTAFATGDFVEKYGHKRGLDRRLTGKKSKDVNAFYNLLEAKDITPENAVAVATYAKFISNEYKEILTKLEGIDRIVKLNEEVEDLVDACAVIIQNNVDCSYQEALDMVNNELKNITSKEDAEEKKNEVKKLKDTIDNTYSKETEFKDRQAAYVLAESEEYSKFKEETLQDTTKVNSILNKRRQFGPKDYEYKPQDDLDFK